jgi:hypothetical protein
VHLAVEALPVGERAFPLGADGLDGGFGGHGGSP